jgi:fructose-1,6-bisphosphatase/sedoheptulose 1,7-bisphosphatase-like protein
MRGVRFFGDGTCTSSVIMQNRPHRIRFIDSIHVNSGHRRQDQVLTR